MTLGYHYTSWYNWLKIEQEGLKPYDLRKPELVKELKSLNVIPWHQIKLYGIFCWKARHHGQELMGDLLFHATGKATTRIVEIEIEYGVGDTLLRPSDSATVDLFHDMDPSPHEPGYKFWHDRLPALLLKNPVPTERLRLLRVFDLLNCELLVVDGAT